MKKLYLSLSIMGFALPTYLVPLESIETGNYLLYAKPIHTIKSMFSNRISTIFCIDLLFAVLVFFIWTYNKTKNLKKVAFVWAMTLLFGLAGALPLFLYFQEEE